MKSQPSFTSSGAPLNSQRGVSLLEVLIAVLILSFGLLGLASLQMSALRNNQSAFDRSRVIMNIYSISDIMRADIRSDGGFNSANTFPTEQLAAWQARLQENLGSSATGEIDCNSFSTTPLVGDPVSTTTCDITITWDDALGLEGSGAQTMTTQVQL